MIFTIRLVIDNQAEVNNSHLIISQAYHEVVRLHISMQVERLMNLLQAIKGLESDIFHGELPLERL
jgi:uncharacterized protein YjiK